MNVNKMSVTRMKGRQVDVEFGLNGRHKDGDRENVLDLLVVIEDERRFYAAVALLSEHPVECERYRALAHEDAALLASIRQGMADIAQRHPSRHERTRQLGRYVGQLMDWSQMSAGRHGRSTIDTQGDST